MSMMDLTAEVINFRVKAVQLGLEGKAHRAAYYRRCADNLSVVAGAIERSSIRLVEKHAASALRQA